MKLELIDWIIIASTLIICFVPALFYGKRAGKSTSEFFASGRSVPWWLAGLSMVATTFSSDTPNLVTDIVRTNGVAGNWVWWAFVLTGVATVFFYARLWRRSGVMTDLEFYEHRYSGKAAGFVRGFRSVYLGLFFNVMIMATVNLAACKIAGILFGMERWQTLLLVGSLNVVFATHSGLWGVLVIDMIQFFIKMTAVIAAAYFALQLPQVGGLSGLVDKLSNVKGPGNINYLNILPDFTSNWDIAVAVFIMPIAVQWWAVWYPGAEPGGGSYIAQRMLASKSEKDALGAVLFFNVAHYVLRPWPWILVGLASIIVYPQLSDIQTAFPNLDPKLLGHDIAYPAMLKFLPVGFIGLMVGGLIAANSSTILTHLNWGASYLVHDFYRRFIKTDATEKHYVFAGRIATVFLFIVSSALVFFLDSALDAFHIILQIGAGTGLLYLLRWFWWRINAWAEVAAMVSSFAISIVLLILNKNGIEFSTHISLIITIAFTTICWVTTSYISPQTDKQTLIEFYKKVRPFGPGWKAIKIEAGFTDNELEESKNNIPLGLLGWVSGCTMIWSALFTVGNFLYGRLELAFMLLTVFAISTFILVKVVKKVWN
ncbi:MAG: Na+:solute symporter [Stygiobacter sp. RIFOXYA12_FULL_38_9]|nr:MAG: Na+:solute symporter [Stygiobacter sp. RIFOXYA12_FULL_38_9]OGV08859.1 MAG: Na+:solute symporter [Stygiobacter sp. RIFOXYB2_FULL_37_11]OGV11453.1 MAG: Na+:solute symporter [Stygiobacter sp. RIFOXYA2_FULL_38_8]OGV15524.1 MAG: Na+:solute symporter [Stygiobacter sp. RIFOXYC2_FULL_38_25]OGV80639.1 MAG: Na+:solute symporter [Stygiobacter sp. GWF2_38_21]RJQ64880.1 MAG: Na+:solute symporter [Stygiobacter sp.]